MSRDECSKLWALLDNGDESVIPKLIEHLKFCELCQKREMEWSEEFKQFISKVFTPEERWEMLEKTYGRTVKAD